MQDSCTVYINDQATEVPVGASVMAALSLHGPGLTRYSIQAEPRSAVCGMGVCQECRVLIDGVRRLACQTLVTHGMVVRAAAQDDPA